MTFPPKGYLHPLAQTSQARGDDPMWVSIAECEGHENFDNNGKFLNTQ